MEVSRMQGPVQPSPGRRAGDSQNASGQNTGELKDWQRNTWFGPVPDNSNPFEEPETAPELLEVRSSSVSDHTGEFWTDQQQTGYQYAAREIREQSDTRHRERTNKQGRRRISLRTVMIVFLLFTAAFAAVYFGVFRIREIRVTGNNLVSSADIIQFSGIHRGDSILRLSEEETGRRLTSAAITAARERNNYTYYTLEFRYIEKELPGTVTIAVREREACCFLTWCGIMYVMDKNGMVLYETENPYMKDSVVLVEVKGLDIRSGAHLGQTMVLSSAAQELIFRDLFLEMKVLGCTDQILEADLSNPSSILLTTRDHFTVSLGNSESLHAKLRALFLVRDKLKEMGTTSGSINVSNPETPFYSPSSPQ